MRQEEAKVSDLAAKLHAMEELKVKTTQQMNKYKAQAESVIRVLEGRLVEEEEAKKKAMSDAHKAMDTSEAKVVSNQVIISSLEMQVKEEEQLRQNLQNELNRYITQHDTQVTSLQQQLAESRNKENELSMKLNHNNQVVQELKKKLLESDNSTCKFNLLSLK